MDTTASAVASACANADLFSKSTAVISQGVVRKSGTSARRPSFSDFLISNFNVRNSCIPFRVLIEVRCEQQVPSDGRRIESVIAFEFCLGRARASVAARFARHSCIVIPRGFPDWTWCESSRTFGAGKGNRTLMVSPPADFESAASTNSAIPALRPSHRRILTPPAARARLAPCSSPRRNSMLRTLFVRFRCVYPFRRRGPGTHYPRNPNSRATAIIGTASL